MSNPIAAGVVRIDADASGVKIGVAEAKKEFKDLGADAAKAGSDAAAGLKKIEPAADAAAKAVKRTGDSARKAAKDVDDATKATDGLSAAQRRIAQTAERMALTEEGGTRAVLEHKAARAGMTDAIAPYIARMDAAKAAAVAEAAAQRQAAAANMESARAAAAAVAAAQRQAADSAAFISSLSARANAIGKTTSQILEMRAAEMGLSNQAAPFIAKIRETEAAFTKTGVSAAQTAAAMRMVPAQMTDVVTQLAGGQNPLLIAIQQGGQLKDSFGGIGPMFAALGKMITPTVVGLTAAAGAAAALAYGFVEGSRESAALNTALIATGGAAGRTAGQISAMAANVGNATGEFGLARDAAQALAASGRFSGEQLNVALKGVVDGTKVTGKSVQELVADFEALGKEPAKAIAKLSEQQNFLTASTQAQIIALENQGRKAEAAALAQRTYADTLSERKGEILENIGSIERAWTAVARALGKAKDAVLSVGRDKTVEEDIERVRRSIEVAQASVDANKGKLDPNGNFTAALKKSERDLSVHQERLKEMLERQAMDFMGASSKQAAADQQSRGAQALTEISQRLTAGDKEKAKEIEIGKIRLQYQEAYLSLKAKGASLDGTDLKGVRFGPDGMPLGGGSYDKAIKIATDKAIDKGAISSAAAAAQNVLQGRIAAIEALAKAEQDALKNQQDQQKKLLDAGAITLRQYYDTSYDLRADSLQKQLRIAQQEEAEATGLKSAAAREKAKAKTAEIQREIEANAQTHADNLKSIGDRFQTAVNQQTAKWANSQTGMLDALANENAMYGKSADAREIAAAGMKVEAEARALLMEQALKNGPVTEEQTKQVNEQAAAYANNARQITANMLAAKGASSLLSENRRFQADSILDEKQRAAAILEIDADVWRERIANATQGSQERQRLEEQFGVWYSNQSMKPTIDRYKQAAQDIGQDAKTAFLSLATDGETKGVWKTFTKGLGASLKTQLLSAVYDTFMKKYVIQAVIGVAGLVGGPEVAAALSGNSAGSGTSSASGLGNLASSAGTALQAVGGFSVGASAASVAAGNAAGMVGADALGTMIAANGSWAGVSVGASATASAAAGTAASAASTAASAMSAIGTAMPYIGAALAAYSLLSGSFKGEKRSGGTFNYQNGQAAFLHGPSGGTAGQEGVVTNAMTATAEGVNSILKGVGSALSVSSLIAGFEGSEKGRGGAMSGITLSNGMKVGEDGSGSNYKGTYYEKNSPQTLTTEAAAALLATDLKQVQIQALQAAEDLPAALKKLIDGIEAESLSDEAVTGLLAKIQAQVNGVTQFTAFVDGFDGPFDKLKGLTYDLKTSLIDAAGGVEPLTANLASYYENFTSEADRMENTFNSMKKKIESVGQVMPRTEAEFKSLTDRLVNGLSETDTEGQKAAATVLGLNGTFKSWADYAAAAAEEAAAGSAQAWATYLETVLTDSEKLANQGAAVRASFEALGVEMPDTVAGLRALVDVQNPLTAEGLKLREALIAGAPAFAAYINSIQQTGTAAQTVGATFETQLAAVQTAAQRASSALSARNAAGSIIDAIDKASGGTATFAARREQELWASMQTASLEQQVSLAGELTNLVLERYQTEKSNLANLVELGKSLRTYVQGLKVSDLSPLTLGQKLAEGAKQYQDTLAKARGGDQVAMQALQGVAQTYLELQRRYSASGADYTATFDSVTGALENLGIATQTNAEQQLATGTQSLDQLKELRGIANNAWGTLDRQYQQAIAASNAEMAGLEAIALKAGRLDDVASLLAGLPAELAAKLQPLLGTSSQVQGWYQNNLGREADAKGLEFWSNAASQGATEQQFQGVASREQALVAAYKKVLGREPDAAGRDFWLASGVAAGDFASAIGKMAGIPGYAKGGLASGMALVGELGPEVVDFRSPARVYTNDQLSSAIRGGSDGGNARLERLVEGLTAEVIKLKAELVKANRESANVVASTVANGADHVAGSVGDAVKKGAYAASERKVKLL